MSTLWNVPPRLSPRRSHWLLKHFPSLASKRFIILHDCLTLAVPSTRAGTQQHRGACELIHDQGLGLSLRSGSLHLATVSHSARRLVWITARGVSGVSGSVLCGPEVGGDLPEEGRRGGEEPRNQFGWSVQEEMMGKLEEWAGAERGLRGPSGPAAGWNPHEISIV